MFNKVILARDTESTSVGEVPYKTLIEEIGDWITANPIPTIIIGFALITIFYLSISLIRAKRRLKTKKSN